MKRKKKKKKDSERRLGSLTISDRDNWLSKSCSNFSKGCLLYAHGKDMNPIMDPSTVFGKCMNPNYESLYCLWERHDTKLWIPLLPLGKAWTQIINRSIDLGKGMDTNYESLYSPWENPEPKLWTSLFPLGKLWISVPVVCNVVRYLNKIPRLWLTGKRVGKWLNTMSKPLSHN